MELKQIPLPTGYSKQYVTVSHGYIIDTVKNLLDNNNYEVNEVIYRSANGGDVVQAVYHINHGDDPELGLMFAWCNSYDRSQRFRCAVGAHVFVCGNGVMIGDMGNYGKVHKGADKAKVLQNVNDHIEMQLQSATNFYNMIKQDKEAMKNICFTEKEIAELMGVLYFKEDLLTSGQLITAKKQFEEPSHDYNASSNSLWSIYNHITYSFKGSHPRKWMDTQANFHKFIKDNYIPKSQIDPNQMEIPVTEETTNPLGEDDMNSCPQQEEWDQQTRIEEGFDHKGGLTVDELNEDELSSQLYGVDNTGGLDHKDEFPKHDPVSLRVRDGEIEQFDDETGEVIKNEALDNAADEEADMIEKEEIIAEREEEDIITEAEVIEEPNDQVSFDNYPGFEVDEDINLSDLNDIESELKKDSQEDHDEIIEKETTEAETAEVEENSKDDKLELPEFEF